jgi:X-domain of DnaJ-containing
MICSWKEEHRIHQKITLHKVRHREIKLTYPVKTDPEKFFQDIFGGERFYDLIGMSSVGKAIGEAMHNPINEPEPEKTAEEKAADEAKANDERTERVRMLSENLAYKLDLYALEEETLERMDKWRARCRLETDELKNERFGAEILKVGSYSLLAHVRLLDMYTGSNRPLTHYVQEHHGVTP